MNVTAQKLIKMSLYFKLIVAVREVFFRVVVVGSPVFCCLLMLSLSGCSQPVPSDLTEFSDLHPVTGRVTYSGAAIGLGVPSFFPVTPPTGDAKKMTFTRVLWVKDGTFELNTFRAAGRGVGVPAGDFAVSFSWSGHPDDNADLSKDDLPEKLPAKLTRPRTSGVRVTVAAGGTVVPDIERKELGTNLFIVSDRMPSTQVLKCWATL